MVRMVAMVAMVAAGRVVPARATLPSLPSLPSFFQCPDGTPPPCVRRTPPRMSVAVLYFTSLSRDSGDVLLADGFTEELNARLGQVDSILVRSRGLVQRYRGTQPDPIAVGRALNTAYVVSGTFRRSADRVRVTAELARAADGAQVWADVFERASTDLMGIEGDLARAVAGGIVGRLAPREQARLVQRPTLVPAAWESYLRGNVLIARRYEGRLNAAVAAYREAVRQDPRFAAAWGRLAEALALAPLYDRSLDRAAATEGARYAADRAMALDSMAPESWIARGMVGYRDGHPDGAAFARAVALDSNLAEARYHLASWSGVYSADDGSTERHLLAAHRLDPSLANAVQRLAMLTWRQGRLFESRRWWDSLAANAPDARLGAKWTDSYLDIVWRLGDTAAARRELAGLEAQTMGRDSVWALAVMARGYFLLGDTARARVRLRAADAAATAADVETWVAALAGAHLVMREEDQALQLLERHARDMELWPNLRNPYLAPLRSEPRFVRLVEATWPK